MVAPLSQASNNSTGMSGYTSSCGAGASTSAYVGTQQLAVLPGCSSSGMGEIQRSTGSTETGDSATYTLGADVDVHSEIHYTYSLPNISLGTWGYMVGLKIIKNVTIKVGTSVWETIDQASMLAMAQLEMTKEEYDLWATGLNGITKAPLIGAAGTTDGICTGGGKLMCCVKGGYRGQLFVAAMPYQSVTVKINFSPVTECYDISTNMPTTTKQHTNFVLYTKQHILSPYERGLMQSTDILQLLSTTQYYSKGLPTVTAGEEIPAIDLSFFNDYCTHVAVWCTVNAASGNNNVLGGSTGTGSQGESQPDPLNKCQLVYNGTSAQGEQPHALLKYSSMMGLASGGLASKWSPGPTVSSVVSNPNIMLFQLANTPCVTSLSTDQSQYAPFAGGDGVANNRYDVIQFKAFAVNGFTVGGDTIHFVAFGAQSVLYSGGGAVKN